MENKTVWIVVGVVIAVFAAVPLLSQLKKSAAPSETPAVESTAETAAPAAAPAAALQPPLLNAGNLAGTAWNAKGYVVQLGAGGIATANTPFGAVAGSWTVEGSKLTISAMGKTIVAQISGDQLLVDGQPVPRAQ